MIFKPPFSASQRSRSQRPLCSSDRKSGDVRVLVIILRAVICATCLRSQITSATVQNGAIERWRATEASSRSSDLGVTDRLQGRRRQSPATLLSHKQSLITGSANSPLTSPYNQFYLTNSVNSPHNGRYFLCARNSQQIVSRRAN